MQKIRIKYFHEDMEKLTYIDGKSDWIDLRAAEDVEMKAGEFKLVPLGIAMELPKGYEAHVVPRSSTYKNFGIIQTNHMGVIDESYCGDNDQWFFPAYALRDTKISKGDRICQFRIMEHQPAIEFEETDSLDHEDRGGIGSTGRREVCIWAGKSIQITACTDKRDAKPESQPGAGQQTRQQAGQQIGQQVRQQTR